MLQEPLDYVNSNKSFLLSCREKTGHFSMSDNHFHDAYELYYLLSGERYYFIKNRTFHITKGDLVLINVQDLHKTFDTGVPGHQRILINFKEDLLMTANGPIKHLLNELFTRKVNIVRFEAGEQKYIENLFGRVIYEIKHQAIGYEVSILALLMHLLVHVNRYIEKNTVNTLEHPSPMHKKASEIVHYINKNYMEAISLPLVSEKFYISQFYLSRLFKEATGFSFIEYLNSVRIKEAQRLLRETDWKVIKIAEKVGYGSIAHFGRVFKEIAGLPPLDYRKSVRI